MRNLWPRSMTGPWPAPQRAPFPRRNSENPTCRTRTGKIQFLLSQNAAVHLAVGRALSCRCYMSRACPQGTWRLPCNQHAFLGTLESSFPNLHTRAQLQARGPVRQPYCELRSTRHFAPMRSIVVAKGGPALASGTLASSTGAHSLPAADRGHRSEAPMIAGAELVCTAAQSAVPS